MVGTCGGGPHWASTVGLEGASWGHSLCPSPSFPPSTYLPSPLLCLATAQRPAAHQLHFGDSAIGNYRALNSETVVWWSRLASRQLSTCDSRALGEERQCAGIWASQLQYRDQRDISNSPSSSGSLLILFFLLLYHFCYSSNSQTFRFQDSFAFLKITENPKGSFLSVDYSYQ